MASKDARQEVLLSTLQACTNRKIEDPQMPPKTRAGLHHHLSQIRRQNMLNMLVHGISVTQRTGGGILAEWEYERRHASDFNPGFVTFVGDMEP